MHPSFARQNRFLTITVALSVALHALAIAVLPGAGRLHEPLRRALDVMLLEVPPPARVVVPSTPLPMRSERAVPKPAKHVVRSEAPAKRPAATPEPKQVLAIPEASAPQSTFSVPQPAAEAAPSAAEPPSNVGALTSSSRESVGTTASFHAASLRCVPPRPVYPLIARRNGIEGTVKLRMLVTRDGRATQVELAQTSGSSALDSAALQWIKQCQFAPARRGQEATESSVELPVGFKLDGTG